MNPYQRPPFGMPFNQNFNPNFPMPVGMNPPQFPPFPHPMQPMMMQQTAPNPPFSHSQFPRPPVNPAPPQPSTTSIENEKMTTVFVGAIPAGVHDEWVERVLKTCGTLKMWKRVRNADGSPKSFGFATYVDPDSLLRALRILGGENRSSGPIQLPALDGTTSLTKIMMKVDENTRKLLDKYRPNKTLSKPEIEADRLAENHLTEVIKAMKSLVPAMVNLRSQNIISNKELQDAGKSDDKDDNGESANDSASRGASETSSLIENSNDPDAALPSGKKESVIASQIAHFKDRINRQKRQEEERLQRIRAAILEHQPPTRPDDQQPVPSILSKLVPRQVHPSKASDSHGQRSEDKRDDVNDRHHERSSKDRHHERERKKRREKRKEKDDEQIGKEDGELVESAHKRRRRSRSRSRSRSRRDRRHRHRRRSESTEKRQRRRRSKSRSESPEETAETSDGVGTQLQNTDSPSEEISLATEDAVSATTSTSNSSAFQKLSFSFGGSTTSKKLISSDGSSFLDGGDDESETNSRKRMKLIPLDYGDKPDSSTEQIAKENKMKKELIERIPVEQDKLFAWPVKWNALDDNTLDQKLKPFIDKKIGEVLGEPEEELAAFVLDGIKDQLKPSSLLEELQMAIDDEASTLLMKIWRMLIFETEWKSMTGN